MGKNYKNYNLYIYMIELVIQKEYIPILRKEDECL